MTSAVQWAIWYAENEMTEAEMNNATVKALALSIFNWANNAAVHGNSLGKVRVARMYTNYNANARTYSGNSQDMLTLIPLPSATVLAGAGLLVVGARRRRTA